MLVQPAASMVASISRGEPVDEPVVKHWPGKRVVDEAGKELPDLVLEPARQATGGHNRLDGRRPEGAGHPQAVGQPWMVAELDGQDLGVDGGRVHIASRDQADGALVKACFNYPAEEARLGAHGDQAVEGDGVAGMRGRLVVGPGAALELSRVVWPRYGSPNCRRSG
jgi:hypothetical protein